MDLQLRKAREDDCKLLFEWFSEPVARMNSFCNKAVAFHEHQKWFMEKLKSNKTHIYICSLRGNLVGQLRIDLEDELGLLSYSVDKDYRGQGIGNKIIEMAELESQKLGLKKIKGYVKNSNYSSQRIFEKNGFKRIIKDEIIEYVKKIN